MAHKAFDFMTVIFVESEVVKAENASPHLRGVVAAAVSPKKETKSSAVSSQTKY